MWRGMRSLLPLPCQVLQHATLPLCVTLPQVPEGVSDEVALLLGDILRYRVLPHVACRQRHFLHHGAAPCGHACSPAHLPSLTVFPCPLSTAFFCAENGGVGPGSRVVVVGCGPVGLLAVMVALHLGAAQVRSVCQRVRAASQRGQPCASTRLVHSVPRSARAGTTRQRPCRCTRLTASLSGWPLPSRLAPRH